MSSFRDFSRASKFMTAVNVAAVRVLFIVGLSSCSRWSMKSALTPAPRQFTHPFTNEPLSVTALRQKVGALRIGMSEEAAMRQLGLNREALFSAGCSHSWGV